MINAILKGIFKLIISLVTLLLTPIDLIIRNAFPSISTALGYVDDFFSFVLSLIPYILSWFHVPNAFITLVVGYLVFRLSVPLAVHTIKLAIHWYNILKP